MRGIKSSVVSVAFRFQNNGQNSLPIFEVQECSGVGVGSRGWGWGRGYLRFVSRLNPVASREALCDNNKHWFNDKQICI